MPNTLLHDALTLLYTAPERYSGVSGVVRNWTDAGIWAEAQATWRAAERSQGALIAPMGRGRGGRMRSATTVWPPSGAVSGAWARKICRTDPIDDAPAVE